MDPAPDTDWIEPPFPAVIHSPGHDPNGPLLTPILDWTVFDEQMHEHWSPGWRDTDRLIDANGAVYLIIRDSNAGEEEESIYSIVPTGGSISPAEFRQLALDAHVYQRRNTDKYLSSIEGTSEAEVIPNSIRFLSTLPLHPSLSVGCKLLAIAYIVLQYAIIWLIIS